MKPLLLTLPLLVLIIIAILFYSPYAAVNGSSSRKHPKCTQLWVYTFPVQKDGCIVFKHLSGHELEKANRANIEFYRGVEAGHLRTLTFNSTNQLNCPSDNSKEFCAGWPRSWHRFSSAACCPSRDALFMDIMDDFPLRGAS